MKLLSTVLLFSTITAAPAVAQLDDCNGYCDVPGMTVSQSQACWASQVHEDHASNGNCSNWGFDDLNNRFVKGPGSCESQITKGPRPWRVAIACTIAGCSVDGMITCGGRQHTYHLSCSGNSGGGAPFADGGRDEASCASSNPLQAGSPDFSSVECHPGGSFTLDSCATPAGGGGRICHTVTD